MRSACTHCGNYLLPCTATATGVHPSVEHNLPDVHDYATQVAAVLPCDACDGSRVCDGELCPQCH